MTSGLKFDSYCAIISMILICWFPSFSLAQETRQKTTKALPGKGSDTNPKKKDYPNKSPFRIYKLETIELVGTDRIQKEKLIEMLGLTEGLPLDDTFVMETRQRLLGLGIFRSVLLLMKKGSKPGLAKLIVKVEDDEMVLGKWAVGSELGVTYGEPRSPKVDPNDAPMGYRINLISRNLMGTMHRGALTTDIGSNGSIKYGSLAYGFPRFARESVQFDAHISTVNVEERYLDSFGFGSKGEATWSENYGEYGVLQYGIAMYLNNHKNHIVPSFPRIVTGPKFSYSLETRFLGFIPSPGWQAAISVIPYSGKPTNSILEGSLTKTIGLGSYALFTLNAKSMAVGIEATSTRVTTQLHIPIGYRQQYDDAGEVFIKFRAGSDRVEDLNLFGSSAVLGIRYHSSGFIAEVALKITKHPSQFTTLQLGGIE